MQSQPQQWFTIQILDGLSRLLCLSLEGQPSSETIEGTAAAWVDALWLGTMWDEERDTGRIIEAFRVMSRNFRRWPVPAQFRECLPRIESTNLKLKKIQTDDERDRSMAHVKDVMRKLGVGTE